MDMKLSAFIPEEYITSQAGRMDVYKKISLITCPEDEADIYDEICDRYGTPPRQVERLLEVSVIRALGEQLGFTKVESTADSLIIYTGRPDLAVWSEIFQSHRGMRVAPTGDRIITRLTGEPSRLAKEILVEYTNLKNDSE